MTLWVAVLVLLLAGGKQDEAASTLTVLSDRGIDLNRDGTFDCLAMEVETRVAMPGTYLVYPELGPDDEFYNGRPFVLGMSNEQFAAWQEGRDIYTNTFDDMGSMAVTTTSRKLRFTLHFDGEDLRSLDREGPWRLRAHLLRYDNFDPETEEPRPGTEAVESEPNGRTRAWSRSQFGRLAAYGTGVDWKLEPDSIAVALHITLDVHRADTLRVHTTAAYDDCEADSTVVMAPGPGRTTLDVRLTPRSPAGLATRPMTISRVRLRVEGLSFSNSPTRVRGWLNEQGLWEVGPWDHPKSWWYR